MTSWGGLVLVLGSPEAVTVLADAR
jgi:hypothetical protein